MSERSRWFHIHTPACTLNTGDIWCGVVTVAAIEHNNGLSHTGSWTTLTSAQATLTANPATRRSRWGPTATRSWAFLSDLPAASTEYCTSTWTTISPPLTRRSWSSMWKVPALRSRSATPRNCQAPMARTIGACRAWTGLRRPRLRFVCVRRRQSDLHAHYCRHLPVKRKRAAYIDKRVRQAYWPEHGTPTARGGRERRCLRSRLREAPAVYPEDRQFHAATAHSSQQKTPWLPSRLP